MRVITVLTGLALGAGLVAAPTMAEAVTCSGKTGGNSDTVGYTGQNSGNSENGYTCAYRYSSGKIKLKPWQTKSWTSNTPPGYFKRTACYKDEKNVTVWAEYAQSTVGSSYTQTATNWDTGNNRHFGGGVLWNTDDLQGNQFDKDHCNWGDFAVNLFSPVTLTMTKVGQDNAAKTITFSVNAKAIEFNPVKGDVAVYRQTGTNQDPYNPKTGTGVDPAVGKGTLDSNGNATVVTAAQTAGNNKYYAVFAGTDVNSGPGVRGWTKAASDTQTVSVAASSAARKVAADQVPLTVVNDIAKAPDKPSARCATGQRMLQVQVGSPGVGLDDGDVKWGRRGAKFEASIKDGPEVKLQILCRPVGARKQKIDGLSLGTTGADKMSRDRRGIIMSGFGADRLTVQAPKVTALAGMGRDTLTVEDFNAVGNGGPGNDRLESFTAPGKGALLIGGPGRDQFVGGLGADRINAVDGSGGDTVRCTGSANKVRVDKGDTVTGNCASVKRV